MALQVIVGTQWGDEGKGRIVDWFAAQADFVARYNGGGYARPLVPHRVGGADTGNWWTFAVGSDDGFRLRVDTSGRGNAGGNGGSNEWVAEYDAPRGIAVGPLLPVRFPSQGGEFPFELVYFETGGGAILHVAAARGMNESFSTEQFSLLDTTREIWPAGAGLHER